MIKPGTAKYQIPSPETGEEYGEMGVYFIGLSTVTSAEVKKKTPGAIVVTAANWMEGWNGVWYSDKEARDNAILIEEVCIDTNDKAKYVTSGVGVLGQVCYQWRRGLGPNVIEIWYPQRAICSGRGEGWGETMGATATDGATYKLQAYVVNGYNPGNLRKGERRGKRSCDRGSTAGLHVYVCLCSRPRSNNEPTD
ncbi:hypothetical protein Btru_042882 [Bulinus truncatus]|nr:hypothetical protein Btru_042882 [Bulinus truncatus]